MLDSNLPKITIIIGVLNMKRYLAATLDSVIRQQYPKLELIVMDACSTDGTLDIIKQYEKHISFWKSEKDKGHSDACNKAIEIATGDFIGILNADDIIEDNLLHKVASAYQSNTQTRLITCGVQIIENGPQGLKKVLSTITDPDKLQLTLSNMLFELPVINARFFHKSIFTEFGKFQPTHPDGSYNLSNDRDFLIKLALAGVTSEIIPEPLYLYLSHDESLTFSNKNTEKGFKEHLLLAKKYLKHPGLTVDQIKLFKIWQTKESIYLLALHFSQHRYIQSIKVFLNSFYQSKSLFVMIFFSMLRIKLANKFKN